MAMVCDLKGRGDEQQIALAFLNDLFYHLRILEHLILSELYLIELLKHSLFHDLAVAAFLCLARGSRRACLAAGAAS